MKRSAPLLLLQVRERIRRRKIEKEEEEEEEEEKKPFTLQPISDIVSRLMTVEHSTTSMHFNLYQAFHAIYHLEEKENSHFTNNEKRIQKSDIPVYPRDFTEQNLLKANLYHIGSVEYALLQKILDYYYDNMRAQWQIVHREKFCMTLINISTNGRNEREKQPYIVYNSIGGNILERMLVGALKGIYSFQDVTRYVKNHNIKTWFFTTGFYMRDVRLPEDRCPHFIQDVIKKANNPSLQIDTTLRITDLTLLKVDKDEQFINLLLDIYSSDGFLLYQYHLPVPYDTVGVYLCKKANIWRPHILHWLHGKCLKKFKDWDFDALPVIWLNSSNNTPPTDENDEFYPVQCIKLNDWSTIYERQSHISGYKESYQAFNGLHYCHGFVYTWIHNYSNPSYATLLCNCDHMCFPLTVNSHLLNQLSLRTEYEGMIVVSNEDKSFSSGKILCNSIDAYYTIAKQLCFKKFIPIK